MGQITCEECHTAGGIDQNYLNEQAEAVMEKMHGEEDIDFIIAAVEGPDDCADVLSKVAVSDRETFMKNCQEADTSLSLRIDGQEFLIIKADKDFIKDDPHALRGLLAHEMMHTVQRRQGVEEEIETVARSYEDTAINDLIEIGLQPAEVQRFIRTVFTTAIFTLKDLYANTELIRQGFAKELENYYSQMLGVENFCPRPDFYGEEADLAEVEDAITFELGLLPAWLPFEALNHPSAENIRHRIHDCYEEDIPQVAYYVHKIRQLYHDEYDEPGKFKNVFFQQIFDAAEEVIEKKIDLPTGQ